MRQYIRCASLTGLLLPLLASAFTPIILSQGWNLVGNSDATPIDVATQLNGQEITTVWKWNRVTDNWAFYTPSMSSVELAAYALSKSYEVLTRIESKEGFWVNTNAPTTLSDSSTTASATAMLVASDLKQGWNLVASADSKTPAQLNSALDSSLKAASQSITTVWAWDSAATTPGWKFYAPALDMPGSTSLADYIHNKGYLPFTTALAATDGFWLNIAPTTATPATTNYLFLAGDSISFDDGFLPVTYTLAQFQSAPGITVKWPMYDVAALEFTLTDAGGFSVPAGQTLSAAVSITDTAPGSQGVVKFYIDNVAISQSAGNITLSVPSAAVAWTYGVATDGSGAALNNLSTTAANSTVTLSTAANTPSRLVLGSTLNSALNGVSSTVGMTGMYKVTLVVTNLPLSLNNGTPLNSYTINVPQSLATTNVRSITGQGLEGYITLTPR